MFKATTIVAVKKGARVAIAGDGQVTFGNSTIIKKNAHKVRRLYEGKILAGFAGSVADAFALFDRFEGKLDNYNGNVKRAAVELAKEWRTDKILRKLEALLIAASQEDLVIISGTGEVIEPDDDVAAVGSGASYATAAARALIRHTDLAPAEIARESLQIAAEICVFTNDEITVEELP
ncbi:MAG: ATP-dependent protease subunit HslV [Dethiobacteria bacterium]